MVETEVDKDDHGVLDDKSFLIGSNVVYFRKVNGEFLSEMAYKYEKSKIIPSTIEECLKYKKAIEACKDNEVYMPAVPATAIKLKMKDTMDLADKDSFHKLNDELGTPLIKVPCPEKPLDAQKFEGPVVQDGEDRKDDEVVDDSKAEKVG